MIWLELFIALILIAAAVAATWLWLRIWRHSYQIELAKKMVMLSVLVPKDLPPDSPEAKQRWSERVGLAEQMFASLTSIYSSSWQRRWQGQTHLSCEILAKNNEIIFFIGTPSSLRSLIEKTIYAYYPSAVIQESREFGFFDEGLISVGASLKQDKRFILPIKTYKQLESDPESNLTNALSKLGESGRGLIQLLVRPTDEKWRKASEQASRTLASGKSIQADNFDGKQAIKEIGQLIKGPESNDKDPQLKLSPIEDEKLKGVSEKGAKAGFETIVRVLAAAPTQAEAELYLNNLLAAFSQFKNPVGNTLKADKVSPQQTDWYRQVAMRSFIGQSMLLNAEELVSLYHFPDPEIATPNIRWLRAKRAPAPSTLPTEGLFLGNNVFRGERRPIYLRPEDRRRHLYMIGMTGTGKTTLFEQMIMQDIQAGRGVCFIDPHGDTAEALLSKIPAHRANDVIYFDPGDLDRPFGLNLLEWETVEQKDFLIQETIQIFYKLFDPNQTGIVGPQFEHWLRNAALTLMEWPAGGTLIEIPRLFTDDQYREEHVKYVTDPVVRAFWEQQMAKTADFHKSEMYNYFISKFGRFMTNQMMRNIIGQAKSSFSIQQVMDNGKILIVNLSKGKVGEMNSALLGMILVAKIYTAAMGRHNIPEEQRRDFYLYVDEFQNLATDTFASILSEARKYRLNLSITNQYISQVQEQVRDAVIGNVGTVISYRIGVPDAELLEKEFSPIFTARDLNNIERFNAYVKLLVDNTPQRPFSMEIAKDASPSSPEVGHRVKQQSRHYFGRERGLVDAEIYERTRIADVPGASNTDPVPKS